MTETVIFEEQTITMEMRDGTGVATITPAPIVLTEGETYRVVVDGISYEVTTIVADGTTGMTNNPEIFNGAPSNGDWVIVYDSPESTGTEGGSWTLMILDSTNTADHTFAIYQVETVEVPERNPNDAVILSYGQNPIEYQNVPKIWLTHPNSTEEEPVLVPFTYGESVSKEVTPDFSGGDMAVEIPSGELVTGLTVKKPEGLEPENIPHGMYIGGVGPGLFQGGGGGGELDVNLKYFMLSIDPDAKIVEINGVLYDRIYADTGSYDVSIPDTLNGFPVTVVC